MVNGRGRAIDVDSRRALYRWDSLDALWGEFMFILVDIEKAFIGRLLKQCITQSIN
jgi:hypothetical protein